MAVPLILIALGLGAALTLFSPRFRARVDVYRSAIRSAHASHQAADTHLDNAVRHAQQAGSSPPQPVVQPPPASWPQQLPWVPMPWMPAPAPIPAPAPAPVPASAPVPAAPIPETAAAEAAVEQAAAATEANQAAAKETAEAAQNAQTEAERQAAAESAVRVLEREKKIADALASLGIGQCGVRSYDRVTEHVKDVLLARLRTEGMRVIGDNPWNIETHQYDVKLRAVWNPKINGLKLIVTSGKGGYLGLVTCDEIWKKIDPILRGVISRG